MLDEKDNDLHVPLKNDELNMYLGNIYLLRNIYLQDQVKVLRIQLLKPGRNLEDSGGGGRVVPVGSWASYQ